MKRQPSIVDLTGMKFGKLTVVELAPKGTFAEAGWVCKCDCGREHVTRSSSLRYGLTTHCGCSHRKFKDRTGQRFGMLTAVRRGPDYIQPKSGRRDVRWVCRCDCGTETLVLAANLVKPNTRQCGLHPKRRTGVNPKKPVYFDVSFRWQPDGFREMHRENVIQAVGTYR